MPASINLKVTSDFAQASADLKKFNKNMSPEERAKIEKYMNTYKDKGIDNFINKQKKATIAIKATKGPLDAAQAETRAYQKEIERLIKKGIDPQDDALKKLTTRYKQLEKEAKDATAAQKKQTTASKFGIKSFTDLAAAGTVAIMAIGRIVSVGRELVNLYGIQEQAEARLEQTIKATGSAANLTASELKNLATELQGVTKFGDEAIIGAESLLLTFKNIGEDTFPRALESILDVSEAMGTGLKESSIQLGKALNDPVGGISALTRVGIQFTQKQKDMIKSLVEMGDTAGAQAIILEELESQFGGVARAAADTATGSLTQFSNIAGDLKEELGRTAATGIRPFVAEATKIVQVLIEMEKETNNLNEAIDNFQKGTATAEQSVVALNSQLVTEVVSLAALSDAQRLNIAGSKDAVKIQEQRIAQTKVLLGIAARAAALDAQFGAENAKIEASKQTLTDANIAAQEELEKIRVAAQSADEKRLEVLQGEINRLAILKQSAIEYGTEWESIESLFQKLAAERNEILEKEPKILENNLKTAQEIFEGRKSIAEEWRQVELERIFAVDEAEKQAHEDAKHRTQERIDLAFQFANAASSIFSALGDLSSAQNAAELQRLEDQGASEEELAQRKKEIAREEAIRGKKLALFDVAISTASAIIGFLANPGGFAGLGLSALAAITGGIQAAAINAQPIPTAQTGTGPIPITVPESNNRGDNVAVMAQAGEQVSVTPRGQSAQPIHITVEIDKQVIYDITTEGNESGEIRITADNIQGGLSA